MTGPASPLDGTAPPHPASQAAITNLSASELARRIAARELTAVEVVQAHVERIEAVNPQLNAVVVPLFDKALAEAAAADLAQRRGQPLGPLHGVPITVKECFHVAGTSSTMGVGRLTHEIFTDNSPLVTRLRRAGAIVLGKTNVPQLMFLHETDNPVYGRTNNPWNLGRSPGGSSGGEAAIIAAGGSPLGLGSDLGGSIRQPAHACGICGLVPTIGRLSVQAKRSNLEGMEAISLQPGPMARTVEDLHLALGVLMEVDESDALDPRVAPVPLGDPAAVSFSDLRIGFWTDDGYFPACPAARRAVMEAADGLRARGAGVERFAPPDVPAAVRLYWGLVSADGADDFRRTLGDSPRDWRISRLLRMAGLARPLRSLAVAGLELRRQRRLAELLRETGRVSVDQYWQLTSGRARYRERFMAAMRAARLDALICPPHALPALKHGSSMHLPAAASYCFLSNLLGVPAGVLPATRVRPNEESDRPTSRDKVEIDARGVEQGSAGLPIGVQVLASYWREDLVLAVMSALESHFRSQPDYPDHPLP